LYREYCTINMLKEELINELELKKEHGIETKQFPQKFLIRSKEEEKVNS
jgi:hypothetical protein